MLVSWCLNTFGEAHSSRDSEVSFGELERPFGNPCNIVEAGATFSMHQTSLDTIVPSMFSSVFSPHHTDSTARHCKTRQKAHYAGNGGISSQSLAILQRGLIHLRRAAAAEAISLHALSLSLSQPE